VKLRDKEIEILQMKLQANNTSQWIWMIHISTT
jgi:hypothetical protein